MLVVESGQVRTMRCVRKSNFCYTGDDVSDVTLEPSKFRWCRRRSSAKVVEEKSGCLSVLFVW